MDIFFQDFEKRFLAEPHSRAIEFDKNDDPIICEMAALWVSDGGDSGGLMDGYIDRLLAEIDRLNGVKKA